MTDTPTIKHIAISGGSLSAWGKIGALRKSHEDGFWNIQDIESIYGTSMGSILATFLSLLKSTPYTQKYIYHWDMLEDYFVKRPWHHLFKMDLTNILHSFQNRGIYDISLLREIFKPIFCAMDIEMDVTMAEFYEMTQIELHFFTVELGSFELVDISYKTHPEWKVLEAVYCSACIPFLFSPHKLADSYYIDGGFLLNFPLEKCIENILCKIDTCDKTGIIGIKSKTSSLSDCIDENDSLFDYIICIFNKIMGRLGFHMKCDLSNLPNHIVCHEMYIESEFFSLYKIFHIAGCIQSRMELVQQGKDYWTKCKSNLNEPVELVAIQDSIDELV